MALVLNSMKNIANSTQTFTESEKNKTLSNSFYEASIILTSKQREDITIQ